MMRPNKRHIIILVAAILMAALFAFYTEQSKPILVRAIQVSRGDIEEVIANTRAGTVKSCRRSQMSPMFGGQIASLPVKKGSQVKAGDLLMQLWNEDLQAELLLANSQAKAAQATARGICVQADIAVRNATRKMNLKNSDAVSAEEVELAIGERDSKSADCIAANASADVAQARINVSLSNLTRTRLVAPFDGVVIELNAEEGEYVTPSPPGIATLPAVDIADSGCFYVSAPIDEVDAPGVQTGSPARIRLDAFRGKPFAAKVRRVADYVLEREKQARTVEVEVEFVNPDDLKMLLPGYSADVEIIRKERKQILRVPTEAIVEPHMVFVFDPDHPLLELRSVEIGLSNWDYTEIRSGVSEKDWVVLSTDRSGLVEGAIVQLDKKVEAPTP